MQTIVKWLQGLPALSEAWKIIKAFQFLFSNQCLSSAALTGGASAGVTTGAAFTAMVNGRLVAVPSGAALAALNGPAVTNAGLCWQVWLLTMDAMGNFYTYAGTPAASLAAVGLPTVNEANGVQAAVGFVTMDNASAGPFVPGTTLLNVANLGITFNNIVGPFFPVAQTY